MPKRYIVLGLTILGTSVAMTFAAAQQAPRAIAIVGATVIDGTGSPARLNTTIIVRGDRIVAVGTDISIPPAATVVRETGRWVIPGLIDAHAHFHESARPGNNPMTTDLTRWFPYEAEVAWMRARANVTLTQYLCSGVTSVAAFGAMPWEYQLRDWAAATTVAPHIIAGGGPIVNIAPPLTPAMKAARDNVPVDVLSRPDEAGPILDRLTKNRIDLVKVVLSPSPNFSEFLPALAELSRQSHARGYRVATHAMQLEVAKAALRTGTDILAHTVVDLPVDDEFIALARDRGAVSISTAGFIGGAARLLQHPFTLEDTEKTCGDADIEAAWRQWDSVPESERPPMDPRLQRAGDIKRVVLGNLNRLYAAGIPIVAGSDAGTVGNQHGPSLQRELRLLAEAGLPPMDVILAGTRNAARALAFEKELGTIQPGKFADLVILSADPLQDVENLDRITHVMIRGKMIARQSLQSQLAKRSQGSDTLVRPQK